MLSKPPGAPVLSCGSPRCESSTPGVGNGKLSLDPAREPRSADVWVALKMIVSGEFASDAAIGRLRAEAEAIAKLDHPGIVKILETGEVEGHPYIAMELLDGGSLSKHLGAFAASPGAAAELIACVARAVDAAHERGILHRDLKPSNIVFDSDGRVVVTDFGLARRIGAVDGLTSSGELLGTLAAMAPEQAESSAERLTAAVDVYALGIVLYETLTGRPPFRGSWAPDVLRQVLYDEPVAPSRIEPAVPRPLDAVCLRCLEKRPVRRYPTAASLAADLDPYRAGEPVVARLPGLLERSARWMRRRPAAAALAALLALVLSALPVGVFWHVEQLRDRANELERREALRRRSAYAARLNLAYDALERHSFRRTTQLLESLIPGPGEDDLRGFGWWHLWRLTHPERHLLSGHRDTVSGIHFLDGELLASASDDTTIKLWGSAKRRRASHPPLAPALRERARPLTARRSSPPVGEVETSETSYCGWRETTGAEWRIEKPLCDLDARRRQREAVIDHLSGISPSWADSGELIAHRRRSPPETVATGEEAFSIRFAQEHRTLGKRLRYHQIPLGR